MSFSYNFVTPGFTDYIRALISDTQEVNHIFEDEELSMFGFIASGVWQSAQKYSGFAGQATLPSNPVNYLRTAALALDAVASNKARLASIKQLLDVKLDSSDAAIQLRAQAQEYRDVDDNSMAFVIIEQVQRNAWSFQERFWSQIQRLSGGVCV